MHLFATFLLYTKKSYKYYENFYIDTIISYKGRKVVNMCMILEDILRVLLIIL